MTPNTVWMNIYGCWKWFEYPVTPGTRVHQQGKVRLQRVGNRHHTLYIRREELCAPYWMKTAI